MDRTLTHGSWLPPGYTPFCEFPCEVTALETVKRLLRVTLIDGSVWLVNKNGHKRLIVKAIRH